jgi:hypothetical protein
MRRRRTRSSNAPCTFIRRSRNICRSSSANWSRSSKREEQDYSEDREKYVAPNSGRERLNGDAQRSLCTLGLQSEKELAVKAARIHSFGPPGVVVVENVPVPSPGPGGSSSRSGTRSSNDLRIKVCSFPRIGVIGNYVLGSKSTQSPPLHPAVPQCLFANPGGKS